MSYTGFKLYVFAVLAVAIALRSTIGDVPFSADMEAYVGWGLNGLIAGLGAIVGPEAVEGIRGMLGKLTGSTVTAIETIEGKPK